MRRAALFLLPAFAAALAVATLLGRRADAALATPGENEATFMRVRMIVVHRQGFETLVVQPEFHLPGAAAREVTVEETIAPPPPEIAAQIEAAKEGRAEKLRAKMKGLPAAEARELKKLHEEREKAASSDVPSEHSKTYGERFRGVMGMCNYSYGDRPGKVTVWRPREAMEPLVWGEGVSEHALQCSKGSFQLSAYESVIENPQDVFLTYRLAPDLAARPARLAWVIPVRGAPLAFGKAPAKILDEVATSTEELLPAPPLGDVVAGLPPPRAENVSGGSIERVPGQGTQAITAVKRLLADGGFGAIPDVDLEKYRGEWTFLLYRTGTPAPFSGVLEPVHATFRAEKLTIPGRIFGRAGVRDFQVTIFSDRIIPPAALRQYGFTFAGRTLEDGRDDGVDYQAKHVPASLKSVLAANRRVAPPLAALGAQGALYRLDGIPVAVQPNVWSSECELSFSTFSSPRKMPDHVERPEDELARAREMEEEGCGCASGGGAPGTGVAVFSTALALCAIRRRKGTAGA